MKPQEWLAAASAEKELLANFIDTWHPASQSLRTRNKQRYQMTITAISAESARRYASKHVEKDRNPKREFLNAIEAKDAPLAHSVLSSAWTLGVPESTDCWALPGAHFIVDILDDPPED